MDKLLGLQKGLVLEQALRSSGLRPDLFPGIDMVKVWPFCWRDIILDEMNILRFIDKIFPPKIALAHCDVPCGIYDPKPAQIAAETIVKMVEKIQAFDNKTATVADRNTLIRCVWTKEEHARKCKEELLILWTDFFKPEHLEMFPNLHDTFWKAAKLCSKNKQGVDMEAAQELKKAVDDIAAIFTKTKAAAKK